VCVLRIKLVDIQLTSNIQHLFHRCYFHCSAFLLNDRLVLEWSDAWKTLTFARVIEIRCKCRHAVYALQLCPPADHNIVPTIDVNFGNIMMVRSTFEQPDQQESRPDSKLGSWREFERWHLSELRDGLFSIHKYGRLFTHSSNREWCFHEWSWQPFTHVRLLRHVRSRCFAR
jgi:hypothetical protein